MEQRLNIATQHRNGATVALLSGRLDADQVPQLEQWFEQRLDNVETVLVLDLSGVSFISSSGLRVLISMARQMKRQERRLVVCGLFGMVREVFAVSGFLEVLDVCHTVDEAVAGGSN